ncbi:MAG: catechol 1,2-dioxygenase [Actinomycetia bacterium]|nr:catechol 1,2-dioxygenase [Actinomycetes bacterium]
MTSTSETTASQERVGTVVGALMDAIRTTIVEQRVTYDEYKAAKQYVIDVGEAGEWPLFADVFFEATVEKVDAEGIECSDGAIEGPYFIPGSPELEKPYVMPMRADEPGDALLFSGTVTSSDGTALAGAQIDMWHSDHYGTYSNIPYPDDRELPPEGNLRARFTADDDGSFEVRTIVPVPYEIPKTGPTGAMLAAAGWHCYRPAHLHAIVTAPGHRSLTAQLYLSEDPYLDSDVAGAVKPGLVLQLEKQGDHFAAAHGFRLAKA